MSDSAVRTKKLTIKTIINIKLRSACGAIVSATILSAHPLSNTICCYNMDVRLHVKAL